MKATKDTAKMLLNSRSVVTPDLYVKDNWGDLDSNQKMEILLSLDLEPTECQRVRAEGYGPNGVLYLFPARYHFDAVRDFLAVINANVNGEETEGIRVEVNDKYQAYATAYDEHFVLLTNWSELYHHPEYDGQFRSTFDVFGYKQVNRNLGPRRLFSTDFAPLKDLDCWVSEDDTHLVLKHDNGTVISTITESKRLYDLFDALAGQSITVTPESPAQQVREAAARGRHEPYGPWVPYEAVARQRGWQKEAMYKSCATWTHKDHACALRIQYEGRAELTYMDATVVTLRLPEQLDALLSQYELI